MCIPVHSPWLSGYIDVEQTVVVITTMGGLFPDSPHTCTPKLIQKNIECKLKLEKIFLKRKYNANGYLSKGYITKCFSE